MAIENLEIRDFDHTLGILSHGGRWYVYIDEPKQWWRAYDSLDLALKEVGTTLDRLLVHEQGQKIKYARHPLSNNGAGTFPAQAPRWRVRVTADCGEEQAEWHVEMLNDSAWLTSGYDLPECLGKLGRRLRVASGPQFEATMLPQQAKPTGTGILPASSANVPQKVMSLPPPDGNTVTPAAKMTAVPPAGSIEDMLTDRVDVISAEIAGLEQRLREAKADTEKRLVALRREQRALVSARSAYRDKIRTHEKPAK